jgi:hypothetical protein
MALIIIAFVWEGNALNFIQEARAQRKVTCNIKDMEKGKDDNGKNKILPSVLATKLYHSSVHLALTVGLP